MGGKDIGISSETSEDIREEGRNLEDNFDNIPENKRDELLLRLSEKNEVAGTLGRILLIKFNMISKDVRNDVLLRLSEKEEAVIFVINILDAYFDKLPENLRNELLLKFSKNDKFVSRIEQIVSTYFDKIPEDIQSLISENIRTLFPLQAMARKPALKRAKPSERGVYVEPQLDLPEVEPPKLEQKKPGVRASVTRPRFKKSMETKYVKEWESKKSDLGMDRIDVPVDRKIDMRKPISEVSLVEPSPRYADFTFIYAEGSKQGQEVLKGHTLQTGQEYQLEVAVRTKIKGIPFKGDKRAPIQEPGQEQNVTLMVTATTEHEDYITIKDPTQTLILPPHGDSIENAIFHVTPLKESNSKDDLTQIRIRLYYEFNLIEVVMIYAEVVGGFDDPIRPRLGLEEPFWLEQERRELDYRDFDKIMPRDLHIDINKKGESFSFTFAFFKSPDQKMVLTATAYLPAPDLEDLLLNIRNIWYDIAMSNTFTSGLKGEKDDFIASVRMLARAGQTLWTKLFMLEKDTSIYRIGEWLKNHTVRQGGIVQISLHQNAASFVFPWALLYDRDISRKDYELPDLEGFWGLRYCIEQQLPNRNKGTDEPVKIADRLKLGFMLWEAFRNADKEISFLENLKARSAGSLEVTPPITDADDCIKLLSKCDAHILYFYTHGYTRHRRADIGGGLNLDLFIRRYESLDENSPLLETYRLLYESIKKKKFEPDSSWIELSNGKLYLEELYKIKDLHFQSHPFVILNMCESAQVTPSLSDSFIHFFLTSGASGVIGTECPMTVEFAHPFAEKFLGDFLAGGQAGSVLLNARRHFMELNNPLGLAYTLFGPATVRFEPPRF